MQIKKTMRIEKNMLCGKKKKNRKTKQIRRKYAYIFYRSCVAADAEPTDWLTDWLRELAPVVQSPHLHQQTHTRISAQRAHGPAWDPPLTSLVPHWSQRLPLLSSKNEGSVPAFIRASPSPFSSLLSLSIVAASQRYTTCLCTLIRLSSYVFRSSSNGSDLICILLLIFQGYSLFCRRWKLGSYQAFQSCYSIQRTEKKDRVSIYSLSKSIGIEGT